MFGREEKKTTGGEVVGFIGKGVSIEGKLTFEDTVRVDGRFKGEINATGILVIGDAGYVEGEIKVGSSIVTGELKGNLEAITKVELRSPAKVFGNIKTPTLIIGEGVIFEGSCIMAKKDASASPEIVDYGRRDQDSAMGQ